MKTWPSKNAELTRDRAGSTIIDAGDTAGIDMPADIGLQPGHIWVGSWVGSFLRLRESYLARPVERWLAPAA